MKIFISYRRADSTYLIGRIKDRLVAAFGEQSVFRDLDDIPSGVDFTQVLDRETNECRVMLVIVGPQWAGITDADGNKRLFAPNDYTRIEVETGLKRLAQNRMTVIPALVMGAKMPAANELPESLEKFTKQNAIEIRNDPDFNHDIEKLIRDIRMSQGFGEEDDLSEPYAPKTIYIAEGSFLMGSPEGNGIPAYETPQFEVNLPAYRIGSCPVTNAQYEDFIRETDRPVSPGMGWDGQRVPRNLEEHPVAGVTWYDSLAYCQWLSGKTGRHYSLPNEAQWEKACRAGNNYLYPWGDEFDPQRSNHGCESLAPVRAYPAQNDWGLFDMVGNVRQWTCSLWGEKRIAPDPKFAYPWTDDRRNDLNASRQVRRVVRGCSMKDEQHFLRCSSRSGQAPGDVGLPGSRISFRVVMIVSSAKE